MVVMVVVEVMLWSLIFCAIVWSYQLKSDSLRLYPGHPTKRPSLWPTTSAASYFTYALTSADCERDRLPGTLSYLESASR